MRGGKKQEGRYAKAMYTATHTRATCSDLILASAAFTDASWLPRYQYHIYATTFPSVRIHSTAVYEYLLSNVEFEAASYHLWFSLGSMYGSVLVEIVHIPFPVLLFVVYVCRRGGECKRGSVMVHMRDAVPRQGCEQKHRRMKNHYQWRVHL